jgi:hypothetical protein
MVKPTEQAPRDFGATVPKQLAAEGGTFVQWAASWRRAVIHNNGPEIAARRTAWEVSFGVQKVARAIRTISEWAKTDAAEVSKWALSVDKLPATELTKLHQVRQKKRDGLGR